MLTVHLAGKGNQLANCSAARLAAAVISTALGILSPPPLVNEQRVRIDRGGSNEAIDVDVKAVGPTVRRGVPVAPRNVFGVGIGVVVSINRTTITLSLIVRATGREAL